MSSCSFASVCGVSSCPLAAAASAPRAVDAPAAAVLDGTVVRAPKAYPVYDDAYQGRVEIIRRWLAAELPAVQTVGRNGMHKYNNQDHSMLTAMMAVWNLNGAEHDIWAVNTDFEYHEEQRADVPSEKSGTQN